MMLRKVSVVFLARRYCDTYRGCYQPVRFIRRVPGQDNKCDFPWSYQLQSSFSWNKLAPRWHDAGNTDYVTVLYSRFSQGQLKRLQLFLVLASALSQKEISWNHFAIRITQCIY